MKPQDEQSPVRQRNNPVASGRSTITKIKQKPTSQQRIQEKQSLIQAIIIYKNFRAALDNSQYDKKGNGK